MLKERRRRENYLLLLGKIKLTSADSGSKC